MSTPAPEALTYETQPAFNVALWPALRLATIVYASGVIVRHAAYWGGAMLDGARPTLATGVAGLEGLTLAAMLGLAIVAVRPTRGVLRGLAICAATILVLNVLATSVDVLHGNRRPLSIVWQLASRVQLWGVPVALLVASRSRES